MSENSIVKKTARIVVVEAVPARRMLLADIMRGFGFPAVATVNKPGDLLSHLKASPVDWIIMPLSSEHTVNGMHILKLITTYPSLHKVRVSMLFTMEERIHIPLAFELGLLSCHLTPYNRESMTRSFEQLFERFASNTLDMTLVSAEYLRQALIELRMSKLRLNLESSLSEVYTADTKILMNLAKAQAATGMHEDAISTLNHAELISKSSKVEIDQLRRDFVAKSQEMNANPIEADHLPSIDGGPQIDIDMTAVRPQLPKINLLGLKSVVIIDPDTKTQYLAETLLKDAGITNIAIYSDGTEAWEAMKDQPEPDLILMEWVISGIAGPLLLQRFRQRGFLYVPIVVASSHVKADDMSLVAEMGVSAVIDKPLDQRTFFKSIVTVLQQTRRPHEQVSLEQKIRSLLDSGNHAEAERLWLPYRSDARIPPSAQWQLQAEFAYSYGRYEEACEQASNALQEFPNSLALLNLLGKCLLKLGRYKVA
ncbi:MAG: response regulator, partial [Proteobacteria bacterium]